MESKKVFARKYRPQSLNEVKGQEQVVQALKNTILMNRISNAYLFSGTRGVGKTSVARIFSRTLNCQSPSEESSACGNCQACNDILDGRCPDVIEIDGASHNGVDEVRKLQESLNFMPVAVKFKVVIIDEVHMLSKGAFNALLKTVEEPPPHLVFIFATTELHKVPDTIVSRCQQIRFRPISKPQVEKVLEGVLKSEKIDFDSEALSLISDQARGSMRDALSILDFCVVYCQDKLTIQKVEKGLGLVEEKILDQILSLINNPEQENWLGCLNKLGDEVSEKSISAQEFFGTLANRIFHHSLSPGKISINNDKLLLWYQILIKDLSTFQVGFIDSQVQIKMQLLKLARVHFWLSGEENEQSSGIKSISNQKQASFSPQKKNIKPDIKKTSLQNEVPHGKADSSFNDLDNASSSKELSIALEKNLALFLKNQKISKDLSVRLKNMNLKGLDQKGFFILEVGSGDPLYDMLKMAVDDLRGFCLKKGLKIKLKLKESSAIFQKPKEKESPVFQREEKKKASNPVIQKPDLDKRVEKVQKIFPGSKIELMSKSQEKK